MTEQDEAATPDQNQEDWHPTVTDPSNTESEDSAERGAENFGDKLDDIVDGYVAAHNEIEKIAAELEADSDLPDGAPGKLSEADRKAKHDHGRQLQGIRGSGPRDDSFEPGPNSMRGKLDEGVALIDSLESKEEVEAASAALKERRLAADEAVREAARRSVRTDMTTEEQSTDDDELIARSMILRELSTVMRNTHAYGRHGEGYVPQA